MSMATRALAAAASSARRAAGRPAGLAALSSSRRGGGGAHHQSFSHSSAAQRADDHGGSAAAATAAQVEAALNRKNVDVVLEGDSSATLLADDVAAALRGVGADAADAHDAWVPDQDTGVFVPGDEAANGSNCAQEQHGGCAAEPSVLDQAVFVRDEEIEDVERPAVDMEASAAK